MKKYVIAGVVALIVLLPVAWYLGSPLFIDTVVDELSPAAPQPIAPPDLTDEEMVELAALTVEDVQGMTDREHNEMMGKMEQMSRRMVDHEMEEEMVEGAPKSVKAGSFRDVDGFHKGSGTATIYSLTEIDHVLRLEDFSVTNGPALHVYLVRDSDGFLEEDNYIDLGELKGNKGNQNYEIPSGTDVMRFNSVIVYCVPFKVLFTVASLE